jgi:hypothetical protein
MNQPIKSPVSVKKAAFNEVQMTVLNALIDLLIPASPDGRMPAAKRLSLFADISDMPAKDRAIFEGGLAELQARSTKRHGVGGRVQVGRLAFCSMFHDPDRRTIFGA